MINRTILMGRLVADPELKTTPGGTNVTTFRIAVDRNYVKSGEERQADFFNIVAWRHTAEFVCKHFKKGSLIAIDGQLQSRIFETPEGNKRDIIEVVADYASFTGERAEFSARADVAPAPKNAQEKATEGNTAMQASFFEDVTPQYGTDDDFPF